MAVEVHWVAHLHSRLDIDQGRNGCEERTMSFESSTMFIMMSIVELKGIWTVVSVCQPPDTDPLRIGILG